MSGVENAPVGDHTDARISCGSCSRPVNVTLNGVCVSCWLPDQPAQMPPRSPAPKRSRRR